MSTKDAYERKLQAQLDLWNADIHKLKAKAQLAAADAEINHEELMDDLRERQQEAQAKLKELQLSGETAWEDLRSGLESAWKGLGDSVKTASSRFK